MISSSDESTSSDSEIEELAKSVFDITKSQTLRKFKRHQNTLKKKETPADGSTLSLGFVIDRTNKPTSVDKESENIILNNGENRTENARKEVKRNKAQDREMSTFSSAIECRINIEDGYIQNSMKKKTKEKISQYKAKDDDIMKKSVITPDFEKKFAIPPYEESLRQQKKQRKAEREKTKGKNWYNLPALEMTEERKNDLEVLQMRKALDPKRFYKKADVKALPKYFQFGRVMESAADFYHSRIPKKQRKSNMVQELLADAEFRKYNKRKYIEIQEAKMKGEGPYKHMKRVKKKKK